MKTNANSMKIKNLIISDHQCVKNNNNKKIGKYK